MDKVAVRLTSRLSWCTESRKRYKTAIILAILLPGLSTLVLQACSDVFRNENFIPIGCIPDGQGLPREPLCYYDSTPIEGMIRVNIGGHFYSNGPNPGTIEGGKWGYVNSNYILVVKPRFDKVSLFSEGMAAVTLNAKSGFIDKTGNVIVPLKFDFARDFSEGRAAVKLKDKWGFINTTGKVVIPLRFDHTSGNLGGSPAPALTFIGGRAIVRLNDKWGGIDNTGRVIIPFRFDHIGGFYKEFAKARLNDQCGLIDKAGKTIIPFRFDDILTEFSEGLIGAALNEKWGFVDQNGKIVIPFQFDGFWRYFDKRIDKAGGFAIVEVSGKRVLIDKNGKVIQEVHYF
jgi:hypothetical protein